MDEKLAKIINDIKTLTVLELSQLVKALEQEFGVSAAAPMMAAPAAGGGAAPAEDKAAEKSTYDVILTSAGASKIPVIKVIREITGLGLKEAKELVDGAPKSIKQGVEPAEAEKIKEQLKAVGAEVELK